MQGHHLSRGQRSVCRQSDPSSRVNRDEARTRRPSDVKLSNLHLTPWASGFQSGGGHDNLLGHGKKILKLSLILSSLPLSLSCEDTVRKRLSLLAASQEKSSHENVTILAH